MYFGVVTKANYKRDISQLNVRPRKLNIIKIIEKNDHKDEKNNNNNIQPINIEYVPIKKERNFLRITCAGMMIEGETNLQFLKV